MSTEVDYAEKVAELLSKAERVSLIDDEITRLKNFTPDRHCKYINIDIAHAVKMPASHVLWELIELGRQQKIEQLTGQLKELLSDAKSLPERPNELPPQDPDWRG